MLDQFYRITHTRGVRVFPKSIAENRKNIRLLALYELMFTGEGAAQLNILQIHNNG